MSVLLAVVSHRALALFRLIAAGKRAAFICVSVLLLANSAYAELGPDADLPVLPRFSGSEVVSSREPAAHEQLYPMAPVSRISGRLRVERELFAKGEHNARTYQIPAPHTSSEAFAQAREHLQSQGAHLLYWCEGRECGASNLWANSVFNNANLYGSDNQQAYALLRLTEPQDTLVALYGITRGNRRAYLQVEQVTLAQPLGVVLPTPATLLRQLRSDGELTLPKSADSQSDWVELVAKTLKLDSTLQVQLSGEQASAWRDQLIARRIRESRISLGAEQGERLSLVLTRG